jgi:hypothetical protein
MPRRKVLIVTSAAVFTALLDVKIVTIAFPISAGLFPHDSLGERVARRTQERRSRL